MNDNIFAYTAPGAGFPGYVSINRLENGDVEVTVREAGTVHEGINICRSERNDMPGNCYPGGPTCNNYCNRAPEKGPIQDRAAPCVYNKPGGTASFIIPAEKWVFS